MAEAEVFLLKKVKFFLLKTGYDTFVLMETWITKVRISTYVREKQVHFHPTIHVLLKLAGPLAAFTYAGHLRKSFTVLILFIL